jgi:hypothetical protein
MGEGRFPDKDKHHDDEDGPWYDGNHMARFNTALQRALDDHPRAEDGVRVTFTADIVRRNPGGIKEYKVTIGGH